MKEHDMIREEWAEDPSPVCPEESVLETVVGIIRDLCLADVYDARMRLVEDLAMDSLRMVMLLVSLEDVFEIELDESDMNPFALITVGDVVALAMKYVSSTGKEDANG